jgi:hypothetical protein
LISYIREMDFPCKLNLNVFFFKRTFTVLGNILKDFSRQEAELFQENNKFLLK